MEIGSKINKETEPLVKEFIDQVLIFSRSYAACRIVPGYSKWRTAGYRQPYVLRRIGLYPAIGKNCQKYMTLISAYNPRCSPNGDTICFTMQSGKTYISGDLSVQRKQYTVKQLAGLEPCSWLQDYGAPVVQHPRRCYIKGLAKELWNSCKWAEPQIRCNPCLWPINCPGAASTVTVVRMIFV